MAGRKPAKMYRQIKSQSYTRRKYMGGVPHNRISQYEMGNKKGTFPIQLNLIANEQCQIRHTSLEACRIAANRYIQRKAGTQGYFLKIRVYPHEVIRVNKMATGAGADRISSGMRGCFGKPVGTAARLKRDQPIMTIRVNQANFKDAGTVFLEHADLLLTQSDEQQNEADTQAMLLEARQTMELVKTAEIENYFQDDCVAALQSTATSVDALSTSRASTRILPA